MHCQLNAHNPEVGLCVSCGACSRVPCRPPASILLAFCSMYPADLSPALYGGLGSSKGYIQHVSCTEHRSDALQRGGAQARPRPCAGPALGLAAPRGAEGKVAKPASRLCFPLASWHRNRFHFSSLPPALFSFTLHRSLSSVILDLPQLAVVCHFGSATDQTTASCGL